MHRPGCSSTASRCSGSRPSWPSSDPAYEDMVTSFLEHAVRIPAAMNRSGLWDEDDGFYYDALKLADGSAVPIKVHSMVGLIPLLPAAEVPAWSVDRGARLGKRFASFLERMRVTDDRPARGRLPRRRSRAREPSWSASSRRRASPSCSRRCSNEDAFLAPTGLRALSKRHATEPFKLELGGLTAEVDYEPGESTIGPVRREFELAGTRLVPAQLPARSSRSANWDTWLGEDNSDRVPDRLRERRFGCATSRPTSRTGSSRPGCPTPPAGDPSTARSRSSRPTRNGTTCSSSTSTSTATPAPASAPRTRPAGPGWSPTSSAGAASSIQIVAGTGSSSERSGAKGVDGR